MSIKEVIGQKQSRFLEKVVAYIFPLPDQGGDYSLFSLKREGTKRGARIFSSFRTGRAIEVESFSLWRNNDVDTSP